MSILAKIHSKTQLNLRKIITNKLRRLISARTYKVIDYLDLFYYLIFKTAYTFSYRNNQYKYLYRYYNFTWRNERAVEIPIIWNFVKMKQNKRILEVGNVLSHYYRINHDVIDKYEKTDSVINVDVVLYRPQEKYDLIISISTLEHVGWDEIPKDPDKIMSAVKHLRTLLKPGGQLIFTLPVNYYNPTLNRIIENNTLLLKQTDYLKRISYDNRWIEVSKDDVKNCKYNAVYPNANAILIGYITN